jgi:excisionase family DNA binding protein
MEYANRLIRDTETAALLGCSRATVWAMAKAGKIPAPMKIGVMARWRLSDIHALIESGGNIPAKPQPRNRVRTIQ